MPVAQGDTSSSGVGSLFGLGSIAYDIFGKKPKKKAKPFAIPNAIIYNRAEQAELQSRIDAAIAAGESPASKDIKRLAKAQIREKKLIEELERKRERKPKRYMRVGILPGWTLDEILQFAMLLPRGQRILAKFAGGIASYPGFAPPFLPSLSGPGGGSTVPFTVTPSFDSSSGGLDFGGFLNTLIDAGGRIGSALLTPKPQQAAYSPYYGPQQASLVPAVPGALGALRSLLPSAGALGTGMLGGEMADAIQNMFTSGGAATADETAAFTDPVPGSCRPKPHMKRNPCTGKGTWFTPRGHPLVFSGDMAACRRVDRVARRLNKAMPRKKAGACRKR